MQKDSTARIYAEEHSSPLIHAGILTPRCHPNEPRHSELVSGSLPVYLNNVLSI